MTFLRVLRVLCCSAFNKKVNPEAASFIPSGPYKWCGDATMQWLWFWHGLYSTLCVNQVGTFSVFDTSMFIMY